MARLAYECNLDLRPGNSSEDQETIKPFACTTDKYCLYCCCNPQCCLLVQRKSPRHFWEAWYFWLGIALLLLFLVSSISSYVVSNCRYSFHAIAFGQNVQTASNRRNGRAENVNEISINVIPTSGMLPSHRKMLLCAPQPSITHMRRKCVCTSKACKEAGVEVCRTRFSCYVEEIYDIDGTSRDNSSTRGCTEGATPLLCETNAWTRSSRRGSKLTNAGGSTNELNVDSSTITSRPELLWPRLKCCDTHDYCNSIVADRADKKNGRVEQSLVKSTKSIVDDENSRARVESTSELRTSIEDRKKSIKSPAAASGSTIGDRETGSTIAPDFEDLETSYDPLRHRTKPLHVAVVVLAIAALTSVLGACYVITRFLRSPFEIVTP